jgi:hypothetical protein
LIKVKIEHPVFISSFDNVTNQSIIDPDLIGQKISPNPSFPKRGIVPPFGKGR